MERCPICRGRITPEQTCCRCKADLTMVLQAHRSAEALTRIAIECLDKEHYSEAKGVLKQARRLKDDPFISTLYGFAKALS